jgi:hypothetical protein
MKNIKGLREFSVDTPGLDGTSLGRHISTLDDARAHTLANHETRLSIGISDKGLGARFSYFRVDEELAILSRSVEELELHVDALVRKDGERLLAAQ